MSRRSAATGVSALLSLFAATAFAASSYYVNAATGNDANPGTSAAAPLKTISRGLLLAINGDAVQVMPGTYNVALGESFPLILGSGVVLRSTAGPEQTIIDATQANPRTRVFVLDGCNSRTRVEGFTITGGRTTATSMNPDGGGGIRITGGCQAVIRRNIIRGNQAIGVMGGPSQQGGLGLGGGIYADASAPSIVNNVFASNSATGGKGGNAAPENPFPGGGGEGRGGGIYTSGSNGGTITNNTFYGNAANGGNGSDDGGVMGGSIGGGTFTDGVATIANIFSNNSANIGSGVSGPVTQTAGSLHTASGTPANNLFFSSFPDHGTTGTNAVLDQNPMFLGAPNDLDIASGSPATGKGRTLGAPATDLDGFSRPAPPAIGAFEPPDPRVRVAGDFNGDGADDVLLRHLWNGDLANWLLNGTAIIGGGFIGSPGDYTVAGIGDLDGNGRADIVLRDELGNIGAWLMNGNTVTGGGLIGSPGAYTVSAVADFNGDGRADILLRDDLGNVGLWFMNGTTITSGALVGSPGAYSIVGVADFNGDLRADILLRDSSGNIGMWLMNGAVITSGALVGSPGAYSVSGTADFSGDGKADILLLDSAGNAGLWIMNGPVITSGAAVGSTGGAAIRLVGDFDNSGHADVLLQSSGGVVGIWMMNGATIVSSGGVASPAVPSYEIH